MDQKRKREDHDISQCSFEDTNTKSDDLIKRDDPKKVKKDDEEKNQQIDQEDINTGDVSAKKIDADDNQDARRVILIFNTGGTISCQKNEHGKFSPHKSTIPTWLKQERDNKLKYLLDDIEIKYFATDPLYDSSNLDITMMERVTTQLKDIVRKIQPEGVVFTHGTDTLAYISSYLTFSIQDCHIPIVITGSQSPLLGSPLTDAESNILGAILAVKTILESKYSHVHGICVYFGEEVMSSTRIRKIHPQDARGFEVVNCLPYGILRKGKIELTDAYFSQFLPALRERG